MKMLLFGLTVMLIGMLVVFVGLIALVWLIQMMSRVVSAMDAARAKSAGEGVAQ